MKAFIYARTSSDDGEKTSITNQIEECKKYAQKNGWEVVGTFFDKDISGYSYWDSPEGHQLSLLDESIKEHYKNKEIVYRKGLADLISKLTETDIVISRIFNRICRQPTGGYVDRVILNKFKANNVSFYSIDRHKFNHDDNNHWLLLSLTQASEHNTKSSELLAARSGLDKKRKLGGKISGICIYGTANGKRGQFDIIPEQLDVVKRIFRDFRLGINRTQIAKQLNSKGVRNQKGGIWRQQSITNVLTNFKYAGYQWLYSSKQVEINKLTNELVESPVLREVAEYTNLTKLDIQQNIKKINNLKTGPSRKYNNPLSGLILCGYCGEKCHANRKNDTNIFYSCRSTNKFESLNSPECYDATITISDSPKENAYGLEATIKPLLIHGIIVKYKERIRTPEIQQKILELENQLEIQNIYYNEKTHEVAGGARHFEPLLKTLYENIEKLKNEKAQLEERVAQSEIPIQSIENILNEPLEKNIEIVQATFDSILTFRDHIEIILKGNHKFTLRRYQIGSSLHTPKGEYYVGFTPNRDIRDFLNLSEHYDDIKLEDEKVIIRYDYPKNILGRGKRETVENEVIEDKLTIFTIGEQADLFEYKGEKKTWQVWAKQFNIDYKYFKYRLKQGWSIEQAIETPVSLPKVEINNELRKKLIKLIDKHTISKISKQLNVSMVTITRWANGSTKSVTTDNFNKLQQLLNAFE